MLKSDLIQEFQASLSGILDADLLRTVSNHLAVTLGNYSVGRAENLPALREEPENEMLLRLFLSTKKMEGKSDKTLEAYQRTIRIMLAAMREPVTKINAFMLRAYLAKEEIRGLSMSSVNGQRSTFCSFFGFLHREGFIDRDPTAQLTKIKVENRIIKPFTAEEMELMRGACGNLRDRAIIEFLRSTGCRISECVSLNIDDVDLQNREMVVKGKGSKIRRVYMDEVATLHLKRYLRERGEIGGALFSGRGTARLTDEGVRRMLKALEKRSGVKNIHPHKFRHTMATDLIRKGMAVQDVAVLLGHSSVNTSMRYIYMDDTIVKQNHARYSR